MLSEAKSASGGNCNEVNLELSAYLDNEVTADKKALIEKHLGECAKCCDELQRLRNTSTVLQYWDKRYHQLKPDKKLARQVIQKTIGIPFRTRLKRFLSLSKENWKWELAAAAGIIIVIGLLIFGPSRYDEYVQPGQSSQYLIKSSGSNKWKNVSAKETPQLKQGDSIKTIPTQIAQIKLSDNTAVRLLEKTEITIKDKEKDMDVINLKEGEIHVVTSNKKQTVNAVKVETPAGVIIDRGTIFDVRIEPQKGGNANNPGIAVDVLVTVMVMEGQILFSNNHGEQVVNAGESAVAQPNSQPVLVSKPTEQHKPSEENGEEGEGENNEDGEK